MWVLMGLDILMTTTIKTEKTKAKFKSVMLKVFNSIRFLYRGDPDFQLVPITAIAVTKKRKK